jgi:hypothetical protein
VAAIAAEAAAYVPAPARRSASRIRARCHRVNNYDFRLLVDRDLYDAAVFTAQSPSLADLPGAPQVALNPGTPTGGASPRARPSR